MYAVIKSGGKQYPVEKGQVLKLEKLSEEVGSTVTFEEVLLLKDGEAVQVGSPTVTGCKVVGVIERHGRDKKVNILKFKRRKHQMKRQGHRQHFTEVKIVEIQK